MAGITLPPPVRWGIVFGIPQAALVLVGACAGALGLGETVNSNMTFGYLFLPIAFVMTTALSYLAGKRTATQTHRWWQGIGADVIAAEIFAISITLIAWIGGLATSAPSAHFVYWLVVPALVAAVTGSLLGMVGGMAAG
jgi:hypothetical protein